MAFPPRRFGVIAVLSTVAVAGILPAFAALGSNVRFEQHTSISSMHAPPHVGQTRVAGRLAIQHRGLAEGLRQFSPLRRFDNDFSASVWPYGLYSEGLPADAYSSATETPSDLEVLPNATSPAAGIREPEPPLDFSYVPGCRPIPNGYHCDDQNLQASQR